LRLSLRKLHSLLQQCARLCELGPVVGVNREQRGARANPVSNLAPHDNAHRRIDRIRFARAARAQFQSRLGDRQGIDGRHEAIRPGGYVFDQAGAR